MSKNAPGWVHGAKARRAGRGRQARTAVTDIAGYRPADVGFRANTGRPSSHSGTFACGQKPTRITRSSSAQAGVTAEPVVSRGPLWWTSTICSARCLSLSLISNFRMPDCVNGTPIILWIRRWRVEVMRKFTRCSLVSPEGVVIQRSPWKSFSSSPSSRRSTVIATHSG